MSKLTELSSSWRPPDSSAVWSVHAAATVESGETVTLLDLDSRKVLKTASLGKLFILLALSELLEEDSRLAERRLKRSTRVGGSGVWQHLDTHEITVGDAARLVAMCSDNVAANALIDFLDLEKVQEVALRHCSDSTLNDYFRDFRGEGVPETVSHGSARDYSTLSRLINESDSPELARVLSWLEKNVDGSLVTSRLDVDPLSHSSNRVDRWFNKTGSDVGVKADTGVVTVERVSISYAAIGNWSLSDYSAEAAVYSGMRSLSKFLSDFLYGDIESRM